MRKIVILAAVMCLSAGVQAQDISQKRVKKDIEALSDDKMLGRGTGEEGEKLAAAYIAKEFKKLKLSPWGDSGTYYQHFSFTFKKTDMTNPHGEGMEAIHKDGMNVVGFLNNDAPYTIIIGAHYDHLGMGHMGSSRDGNPEGKIHNGADDNASGTAGVMELARYYTHNKVKEKCNFIFICFSGEELGLVGSKKFTEYPKFNRETIQAMLNMDMIGRFNDSSKKLMVYGIGTSPTFGGIVQHFKPEGIELIIDSSGTGPTDHTSFYLKDIPVLSFFTGQHKQYHTPDDDAKYINFKGEVTVLKYIATVADSVASMSKPVFTKTATQDQGEKTRFKVTLGIMPDYTFEGKGVKVDDVTINKPAFKAGVKAGDVIIHLGDYIIGDINDYMKALSKFNKGDQTTLVLKRGEESVVLDVEF